MEILHSLEPLLRVFWYIAIPVSIIFIIQAIMTFVGGNSMDGVTADFDSDFSDTDAPFQLFSLRNLINFLLGFSWSGIAFYNIIGSKTLLLILAIVTGIVFVAIFFVIIRQLMRLTEDDSFRIDETLYKTAEVYLTIPGNRIGKGKILISVNGSVRELEAMTDSAGPILSHTTVKVVKIENKNVLIVAKI
ncbi:MAG: hypothetical protein H6Q19_607 [Bacteroidetes bacterium]|nr:hypothetical protein [Bacteroidota bacterium]